MKQTPSDVKRVTQGLLDAESGQLDSLPRDIITHYFNEVSAALLNWMGKGQVQAIEDVLRMLGRTILSKKELAVPAGLTSHQRIGMQLATLCALMSVYLKVQTSVSYNSMLTGKQNRTCRYILRAFLGDPEQPYQLSRLTVDDIKERLEGYGDEHKGTSRQNIDIQLKKLVTKGLVNSEHEGNRVYYRLSDLGKLEAKAYGPLLTPVMEG
ncbi:hypothetical protein GCM10023189_33100 [Nibrella saemangeumensis]|uniref:Uncharacterized protein n=2 Tax=Nibrella saemangeumensis TaxID=1084526 RepID=A0ABP8N0V7_9BACT